MKEVRPGRWFNEEHLAELLQTTAADLLEALKACAAQFRFYESEHVKAGKHEKAATNRAFAERCEAAIARAEGRS